MTGFTVTRCKPLRPPFKGWSRKWLRCRKHGRYYSLDYQPYSLSNPVMWLDCGCSPYRNRGERDVYDVTEAEALTGIYCQKVGLPWPVAEQDA